MCESVSDGVKNNGDCDFFKLSKQTFAQNFLVN